MSLLTNVTATSCSRWRAALDRHASGGAPATVFCAGDSNSQDDNGLLMWHEKLRALRQTAEPGVWDDGFAYFTYPPPPTILDPRRTLGTNWAIGSHGQQGPALNGALTASGSGGTPFTYGEVYCDEFELMFSTFGGGDFAWSIDDGPVSDPVSVAGPGDVETVVIPAGAPGLHTLKLHAITTAVQPTFIGVAWTDSTNPKRRLAASGRFGAGTDLWVAHYSLEAVYTGLRPDLTIALIGSNDYGFLDVTTEETLTNLDAWIDIAHDAGSDFLLTIPAPSNYQPPRVEPPADLAAGLIDLAAEKDVPLVDLRVPFVDFATMQANGHVSDHVHFTNSGHAVIGDAYDQALVAMSGGGGGTPPPAGASGAYRFVGGELVPVSLYGLVGGDLVPRAFVRA